MNLNRFLLFLAVLFFLLGAIGFGARVNLVALGLFFWTLSLLLA